MASQPTPRFSTTPRQPTPGWSRFDRVLRLSSMIIVVGIVVAAMLGVAGLRTSSVAAANGTVTLKVTYAKVSRPGIPTPLRIEITATDLRPLPDELVVAVGNDYLSIFDQNGLDPEPDATHFDGDILEWTYSTDAKTTLVIALDARLQPNIHRGRDASVTVSAPDMEPVSVRFHTTVFG